MKSPYGSPASSRRKPARAASGQPPWDERNTTDAARPACGPAEREEIERRAQDQKRSLTEYERLRLAKLHSDRVEEYLDQGRGDCWLKNPKITSIVVGALNHFDGDRYALHALCVMPNHVHVVFNPVPATGKLTSELIPILHSWKFFTAHAANRVLGRSGKFWQEEYYDHRVRNEKEFWFYVNYTLQNPVKAGLCSGWEEWPWTGCSDQVKSRMLEFGSAAV